jgi:hypothetical protein
MGRFQLLIVTGIASTTGAKVNSAANSSSATASAGRGTASGKLAIAKIGLHSAASLSECSHNASDSACGTLAHTVANYSRMNLNESKSCHSGSGWQWGRASSCFKSVKFIRVTGTGTVTVTVPVTST